MLIDEVQVTLEGGHGGPGKVSFYPGKKSGPDGGNGGKGGDIYIMVTSDLMALNQFSKKKFFKAEDGLGGSNNRKSGQGGEDLVLRLPIGSELTNLQTGENFELNQVDQKILFCNGGLGGLGNFEFKSSRNTTPEYAQPGLEGERKSFDVNLKFLADFGLIGLPNAGKSSLLNELTSANVKVANYPFTTLEANLGSLDGKIIADIPGLIEGASTGKGLGIKFLKHIEKVKLLLHCLSLESEDPGKDYKTVIDELKNYNPELLKKKEIILLTKADLVDQRKINQTIKKLKSYCQNVYPVSIHDYDSLEKLKILLKLNT